jgi:hypothetical protein
MLDLSIGAWVCLGICAGGIVIAWLLNGTSDDGARDWHQDSHRGARRLRR